MLRKWVIGFTIAMGVVTLCLVAFYMTIWPKVQRKNAALIAHLVEHASEEFREEQGSYPSGTLTEIIGVLLGNNATQKSYLRPEFRSFLADDGTLLDSWRRPFRLEPSSSENGAVRLRSSGENGLFDDEDDITSHYLNY